MVSRGAHAPWVVKIYWQVQGLAGWSAVPCSLRILFDAGVRPGPLAVGKVILIVSVSVVQGPGSRMTMRSQYSVAVRWSRRLPLKSS